MRTGGEKMNLKVLRKRKGFSQRYMANQLNIGLPMFWLINLICIVLLWTSYTLLSAAKKDKAKGIAKILNININDIFLPVWFTIREQE